MKFHLMLFAFCLSLYGLHAQTINDKTIRKSLDSLSKNVATGKQAELRYRIAMYYLEKPGETAEDLDSAWKYNKESQKISAQRKLQDQEAMNMLLSARILDEKGRTEDAKRTKKEALDFSQLNRQYRSSASIMLSMADDLPDSAPDQKIALLDKALKEAKNSNDRQIEGQAYMRRSGYFANIGEYERAKDEALKALALKNSASDLQVRHEMIAIAANLRMLFRLKEALQYALGALQSTENTDAPAGDVMQIYNLLGLIYYDLKLNSESITNYRKAFQIATTIKDRYAIHTIALNLATLLNRQKKNKEAIAVLDSVAKDYQTETYAIRYTYLYTVLYSQLGQLAKAEPYYREIQRLYNKHTATGQDKHVINIAIAYYLAQSNQPGKMYPYLDEIFQVAKQEGSLLRLAEIHKLYFRADSLSGDYLSAIKHLNAFRDVTDTIHSRQQAKELAAIQLQYNTEKKDRDILLLTQNGQLQQSKLKNEATFRYIFISGIIILSVFIAFLYVQNRLKRKINHTLQVKQDEINAQNEQLRELILEKEWLLKEIHHRVKNNMQIIISLLNTQSAYLENDDAIMAIRNSQNRMHAMSLIHQKLYQTNNLSRIDMKWYIHELIDYLKDSYDQENNIHFDIIVEKIELDVSQAVPVGLILNEAITNAMKHAFSGGKGSIQVNLHKTSSQDCRLTISDDGVGIPQFYEPDTDRDSFGMNLMQGLSDQLDGQFSIRAEKGVCITIQFTQKSLTL